MSDYWQCVHEVEDTFGYRKVIRQCRNDALYDDGHCGSHRTMLSKRLRSPRAGETGDAKRRRQLFDQHSNPVMPGELLDLTVRDFATLSLVAGVLAGTG